MAEGLEKAQAEIARVGQLLLSPTPDALDHCTPLLQAAIAEISSHRLELRERASDQTEFKQVRQLRESVGRVSVLLEGAARFHRNWIRRRDAMLCGYAPDGKPASSRTGGVLAIEG